MWFSLFILSLSVGVYSYTDIPCQWKSKSGATYDLRALTLAGNNAAYAINDGDIPCTPEIERTYSFAWNFCADVPVTAVPEYCQKHAPAAAYQYFHRESDNYNECNAIGHYDPSRDDTYFSLLDVRDPSKGVSMKYLYGDRCPNGALRTTTIDVQCANVKYTIESALEPTACDYHVIMKSMYGCPQECPLTSNGLCNGHGHCGYDPVTKAPHCYCNNGYSGNDCGSRTSSNTSYNGLSVQIGLLSGLLAIALILVAVVGYLAYRVSEFRKMQQYSQLASANSEHGLEFGTINF